MVDPKEETREKYRLNLDRYTYFLLAIAASAIAFATQRTLGLGFFWTQIPLALAVLSWGISFYSGCRSRAFHRDELYVQMLLQAVDDGTLIPSQNSQGNEKEKIGKMQEDFKQHARKVKRYAECQFWALVVGGILFLLFHLLGMAQNTYDNRQPSQQAGQQMTSPNSERK